VRFLRATGCRPGEACRARWREIDLGGDLPHFRPAARATRTATPSPPPPPAPGPICSLIASRAPLLASPAARAVCGCRGSRQIEGRWVLAAASASDDRIRGMITL
jgi:hypothetical protein